MQEITFYPNGAGAVADFLAQNIVAGTDLRGKSETISSAQWQTEASTALVILALSDFRGLSMALTVIGDGTAQHQEGLSSPHEIQKFCTL